MKFSFFRKFGTSFKDEIFFLHEVQNILQGRNFLSSGSSKHPSRMKFSSFRKFETSFRKKFSFFRKFKTSFKDEIFFLHEVSDLVKEQIESLRGVRYFLSEVFYLIYPGYSLKRM